MDYFYNLLLRSFFTFYISASVANKLHDLADANIHRRETLGFNVQNQHNMLHQITALRT